MTQKSHQRGMTLLETLIALIILAGALTAALAISRTAERLNSAGLRRQQSVDSAFGEAYLRALLEGAAPVIRETVGGAPILDFSGGPDEIAFYSSHFAEAETPHLARIRLHIVDGAVLLSRDAEADGEQEQRTLMIFEPPLRFRYGLASMEGGVQFRTDWINQTVFPSVIVIERPAKDESAPHPEFVATPFLSAKF